MEHDFATSNPKVSVSPTQIAWRPFPLPDKSEQVTFVQGLKTVCGNGSPESASGLAISMYLANTSMDKEAFINNDGDMCVCCLCGGMDVVPDSRFTSSHRLICPQLGRLDIQTELGHLMVAPGEICVIQKGLRIKVKLPDGPSRGYIQEVRSRSLLPKESSPDLAPFLRSSARTTSSPSSALSAPTVSPTRATLSTPSHRSRLTSPAGTSPTSSWAPSGRASRSTRRSTSLVRCARSAGNRAPR